MEFLKYTISCFFVGALVLVGFSGAFYGIILIEDHSPQLLLAFPVIALCVGIGTVILD